MKTKFICPWPAKSWLFSSQYKAALYRIYINIMYFIGFRFFFLKIDRLGADFWYKGDTIIWFWESRKWVSIVYEWEFASLKEYDKLKEEFNSSL